MRKFICIAISLCITQLVFAQQKQILPRNETNTDPSLTAFVADLQKAIAAKDKKWILASLDKDVESSVDQELGAPSFESEWNLNSDTTDFWRLISRVVQMGGVFLHDTSDHTGKYQFVFPYAYDLNLDSNMDDDYAELGVITAKNVNIRKDPDTKSAVVTQLSYNLVRYKTDKNGNPIVSNVNDPGEVEWMKIESLDKSVKGWINSRFVYSLMGQRLFLFKDPAGQWKISAFLIGD